MPPRWGLLIEGISFTRGSALKRSTPGFLICPLRGHSELAMNTADPRTSARNRPISSGAFMIGLRILSAVSRFHRVPFSSPTRSEWPTRDHPADSNLRHFSRAFQPSLFCRSAQPGRAWSSGIPCRGLFGLRRPGAAFLLK